MRQKCELGLRQPWELKIRQINRALTAVFKKFRDAMYEYSPDYRIILMIDEFTYIYDWIRKGKMTDRIMKFWKAFIQNNGVFAIIIGQDHMMRFVEDERFTNDFGTTDLQKISYLSKEDAKKLMDEPIMFVNEQGEGISRYKEGALDRLYDLTSGSAFLIGQLCAGLVDYINEVHSVYITRAHIDEYLKLKLSTFEESRYFDPQYHDKSDIEHETEIVSKNKNILKRIANNSNNKEWTPLSKVILSKEDRVLIDNLVNRDVVTVKNDRCKIKVVLYKEWLLEKYGWENKDE